MPSQSVAEKLASLPKEDRERIIAQLTPAEQESLLYDWRGFLARPDQIAPDGDWDIWLVLSGRGWGKTRTGAEWVREMVDSGKAKRIALIAETAADGRDVIVEGQSGILACYPEQDRPTYEPSKRRITWKNGAIATVFNATEPDQLRGPQFDAALCDELCLIAGTLIETEFGQKTIETVQAGDRVWTRKGLRRVAKAWKTTDQAEVWKLISANGKTITGTANHPVWTDDNGFVPLRLIQNGAMLCAWKSKRLNGAANTGIYTGIISVIEKANCFIGKNIKTLTGSFQDRMMSTIKMVTRQTMILQTWSHLVAASTYGSTGRAAFNFGPQNNDGKTQLITFGVNGRQKQSTVRSAIGSSNRSGCERNIAGEIAGRKRIEELIPTTTKDIVASVERLPERVAVYNLEVEGDHEYFANGILTHNCKWRYARDTWDQLQFGLRLGDHPRVLITTTPRPIELIKGIIGGNEGKVYVTRGNTMDNRSNLAEKFLEKIVARYDGTRLGRQELRGEILGDIPNALWTYAQIESARVREQPEELDRIIVAVDPAISNTESSDEHGIIVAGYEQGSNEAYVLEDASMTGTPMQWARRAIAVYDEYEADGIVIEVNQGGDMVAQTLRSVRNTVKIIEVRASRGKHIRAEPIASLYEQGRVRHVGAFPELETQMTQMTTFGFEGEGSPDRLDALVWALSNLFPAMVRPKKERSASPVPTLTPFAR